MKKFKREIQREKRRTIFFKISHIQLSLCDIGDICFKGFTFFEQEHVILNDFILILFRSIILNLLCILLAPFSRYKSSYILQNLYAERLRRNAFYGPSISFYGLKV